MLHHGLWQLRSVLAAGRGGADGYSEDEENRGDGLHWVAVVWLLCGVLSAPYAQIRVCIWRQGRKRFADETY